MQDGGDQIAVGVAADRRLSGRHLAQHDAGLKTSLHPPPSTARDCSVDVYCVVPFFRIVWVPLEAFRRTDG